MSPEISRTQISAATPTPTSSRRLDTNFIPENSRDLIPRLRNRLRSSVKFRRGHEKTGSIPLTPPSTESSTPDTASNSSKGGSGVELSRAWQVRPLRFRSQSASVSPVIKAHDSFTFGADTVAPVLRESASVCRRHRRVASAGVSIAGDDCYLPRDVGHSSSFRRSDHRLSTDASSSSSRHCSEKTRLRAKHVVACVCVCRCACRSV